jgi:hypothetical protein
MLALFFISALTVAPAPSKPNVVDDFLGLPSVALNDMGVAARKKSLRKIDLKNGYLAGKTEDGEFRVALFVRKDGRHLVGVQIRAEEMDCVIFSDPKFYELGKDGWVEVTARVWPGIDARAVAAKVSRHFDPKVIRDANRTQCGFVPADLAWELPETGTSVRAYSQIGDYVVVTYRWDPAAGRFVSDDPKLLGGQSSR